MNTSLNKKTFVPKLNYIGAKKVLNLIASLILSVISVYAQSENTTNKSNQWLSYGNDKGSSKYSPITQIDTNNFSRLQIAWTCCSIEENITKANPDIKNKKNQPVDLT